MKRLQKLQPWYHQAKPRCVTETLREEQCINSATFQAVGKIDIFLCKTHADMADFKVKRITESVIILR